jgi:hypothetical protein
MENEYTTKEMKPTETKVKKVKAVDSTPYSHNRETLNAVYEQGGRYKFMLNGEVYQYKTREEAEAGKALLGG